MGAVVLFDFDGTLTRRSTIVPFFLQCVPIRRLILHSWRLAPLGLAYGAKLFGFPQMMVKCTALLLVGLPASALARAGDEVARRLDGRKGMWEPVTEILLSHLRAGDTVAIVTGGFPFVAQSWLRRNGIEGCHLFSSEVRISAEGQVLSAGNICVGANKLDAVKWASAIGSYVISYGNSSGDEAMLRASDVGHWVARDGRVSVRYQKTAR